LSEDYKILKARVKRQYSREKFYEWLEINYSTKIMAGGNGSFVLDIKGKYSGDIEEEV